MFRNRPHFKIALIIISVIVVVAISILLIVIKHYKGVVKKELPIWFATKTNNSYTLSIKKISVNIFTNSVAFHEVTILPNKKKDIDIKGGAKNRKTFYAISVPKVCVRKSDIKRYLKTKQLSCNSITVEKPNIVITHFTNDTIDYSKEKERYKQEITINKIEIIEGLVLYNHINASDTSRISINNCNILLNDWYYNNSHLYDSSSFFCAESAIINTGAIKYFDPKTLYNYSLKKLSFNSKKQNLTSENIIVEAKLPKEDFYKQVGHQCDIYTMKFHSIELAHFDWQKLLRHKEFIADNVYLNNSTLNIFHSRIPPKDTVSKLGNYPHQLLQKLPIPIHLKNVNINNGSVGYAELNNKTNATGEITFSKISGQIHNITNIEELLKENDQCVIKLNTKFNGYSDLNAFFTLRLSDPKGYFSVKGTLTDLVAHQINEPAKALTRLNITSLRVQYLDIDIKGNENYAEGNYTMAYKGFKVRIPKMRKKSEKQSDRDRLLSLIANNVFIYTHNPMPGCEIRHATSYQKRDEYKSFFNLIWKNIFQGALRTAVRNPEVIELVQKMGNTRKEPKGKGRLKRIFRKKNSREHQ